MRFLIAFLLFLCLSITAPAQPDTLYGYGYLAQPMADTLKTTPDAAAWQRLTSHKEYAAYKDEVEFRDVVKDEENLRKGVGFLGWLVRVFGTLPGRLVLFAVFAFLAAWLIYRWLKNQGGSLFYKNKKFNAATENPENAAELAQDWQQLMAQAAGANDFRTAIRYGYLWLLQVLNEKEWIDYHPNKTNRDYAAAMQQPATRDLFVKLSRLYERTWYGYRPAGAADFENFRQQFETLKTKATV